MLKANRRYKFVSANQLEKQRTRCLDTYLEKARVARLSESGQARRSSFYSAKERQYTDGGVDSHVEEEKGANHGKMQICVLLVIRRSM